MKIKGEKIAASEKGTVDWTELRAVWRDHCEKEREKMTGGTFGVRVIFGKKN